MTELTRLHGARGICGFETPAAKIPALLKVLDDRRSYATTVHPVTAECAFCRVDESGQILPHPHFAGGSWTIALAHQMVHGDARVLQSVGALEQLYMPTLLHGPKCLAMDLLGIPFIKNFFTRREVQQAAYRQLQDWGCPSPDRRQRSRFTSWARRLPMDYAAVLPYRREMLVGVPRPTVIVAVRTPGKLFKGHQAVIDATEGFMASSCTLWASAAFAERFTTTYRDAQDAALLMNVITVGMLQAVASSAVQVYLV